jgi:hypothetical protein
MTGLYAVFLPLGLVFLSVHLMVPTERARLPLAGIVATVCFLAAAVLATVAIT